MRRSPCKTCSMGSRRATGGLRIVPDEVSWVGAGVAVLASGFMRLFFVEAHGAVRSWYARRGGASRGMIRVRPRYYRDAAAGLSSLRPTLLNPMAQETESQL